MEAIRCKECGDVRWSFRGFPEGQSDQGECELCGGGTAPERRLPAQFTAPREVAVERRDVPETHPV